MNDSTRNQLIRIKLLFNQGLAYSRKKDDISAILSIQIFDFTVETFLRCVVTSWFSRPSAYNGTLNSYYAKNPADLTGKSDSRKWDFYRVWDEVTGIIREPCNKLSIADVPQRREMANLHEIRNKVQHNSAVPSTSDVEKYTVLVRNFLEEAYTEIFKQEFKSLSVASFVDNPKVKRGLDNAYSCMDKKDWLGVAEFAAIARFEDVESAKAILKNDRFYDQIFPLSDFEQDPDDASFQHEVTDQIKAIWEYLLFTSCGVDYGAYLRLIPIMPSVQIGNIKMTETGDVIKGEDYHSVSPAKQSYSEEEAVAILTFVEEQILQLQSSGIYEKGAHEQESPCEAGTCPTPR